MAKLKIAVDVTPLVSGGACGGAKPFVLELLRGFGTRAESHDMQLLTAAHNHDDFAEFESLGMTRRQVETAKALGLRRQGFDLLFCPMTAPTYAEPGVPTICTLYDLQHLVYPWFFSEAEQAHRDRFYRQVTERVDHVVCISEFSRRSVVERLGVPMGRTSVVPISIHQRLQPQPPDEAWRVAGALGLTPCRFALYPANFWPHKNHRMLLVAFARFINDYPSSTLHLVLTGEPLGEGTAIAEAIARMGLTDRVHVLGFVSDHQMSALWSVSELLMFPSLYEGFGIPVLEAMHFGKPVLCSREGSLPEVGGEDVSYFDARDPQSIVDALAVTETELELLRRRAHEARVRLAQIDPMAAVNSYARLFDRLAATRTHRRETLTRDARFMIGSLREMLVDRRRARGTVLMKSGLMSARQGRYVGGVSRLLRGAVIAPDVAAMVGLRPVLGPLVSKARGLPIMRDGSARPWPSEQASKGDLWHGWPMVLLVNGKNQPKIKKLVPKRLRPFFLNLYCLMLDGISLARGRRDVLTPPKRLLRFATDPNSDFRATGQNFADFLVRQCGLRRDHKVLDVGCGVGRVAVALTAYLDSNGRYEGFDIVPQEVAWCTTNVSSKFPNFHFQFADVRSMTYNPKGGTRASEYRFPYDDRSFDIVVLASVFTHMLSRDMDRYVMEVSRVLKRGGRCFVSFYLLNDETRKNIEAGNSVFDFSTAIDGCRVDRADNPESAVAHEEERVRQLFGRCGLLIDTVFYGTWSSGNAQMQDIILASHVMP